MVSTAAAGPSRTTGLLIWGWLAVNGFKIWIDRRWPGSIYAVLAGYAFTAYFLAWFGSKTWAGYWRRRPYWTGESWQRYLRLVAMPVLALIVFFTELYLTELKGSRIVFGAPQSALRTMWGLIDLGLMAFGAIGLSMAINWMENGEPSEQFTRTRWFRRGHGSAIAD